MKLLFVILFSLSTAYSQCLLISSETANSAGKVLSSVKNTYSKSKKVLSKEVLSDGYNLKTVFEYTIKDEIKSTKNIANNIQISSETASTIFSEENNIKNKTEKDAKGNTLFSENSRLESGKVVEIIKMNNKNQDVSRETFTYSSVGKVTKNEKTDYISKTNSKVLNYYNLENLLEKTEYFIDDKLQKTTTFTYENAKIKIKESRNAENKPELKEIHTYSKNREEITYYLSDKYFSKESQSFNKFGFVLETRKFDNNNNLTFITRNSYDCQN